MRKITEQVCSAFCDRKVKSVGNTVSNGKALMLHGNIIAEWRGEGPWLWIRDAGWPTVTTRERLNGLPGVSVSQSKFKQYLNGKQWDGKWTPIGTLEECIKADADRYEAAQAKYASQEQELSA